MAYDEELAQRVRQELAGRPATERRMFGGLAFLLGGHLAVAAGQDGLMVRCDPADTARLVAEDGVEPVRMQGREISGWLRVRADGDVAPGVLARWVEVGSAYAASLPPKP